PLAAHHQPIAFEFLQGFADRPRTDAQFPRKLHLVGQRPVGLPLPVRDLARQQLAHLEVKGVSRQSARLDRHGHGWAPARYSISNPKIRRRAVARESRDIIYPPSAGRLAVGELLKWALHEPIRSLPGICGLPSDAGSAAMGLRAWTARNRPAALSLEPEV